jgi:hypothetical protein
LEWRIRSRRLRQMGESDGSEISDDDGFVGR